MLKVPITQPNVLQFVAFISCGQPLWVRLPNLLSLRLRPFMAFGQLLFYTQFVSDNGTEISDTFSTCDAKRNVHVKLYVYVSMAVSSVPSV